MNRQEILNTCVERMVEQGAQSITGAGNYTYIDNDGNMCAIGLLFGRDLSITLKGSSIGGYSIDDLIDGDEYVIAESIKLPEWANDNNSNFLLDVQGCHDFVSEGDFIEGFLKRVDRVVENYGLNKTWRNK